MHLDPRILLQLLRPVLTTAGAVGMFAYLLSGGVRGAAVAVAACGVTGLVTALFVDRQQRAAQARLRCPDLRERSLEDTGLFQPLLQDTFGSLARLESELKSLEESRTQFEARYRVRLRQNRRLELGLSCLNDPFIAVDGNDQLVSWNQAAADLLLRDHLPGPAESGILQSRTSSGPSLSGYPELMSLVAETRRRSESSVQRSIDLEIEQDGTRRPWRATATHLSEEGGSLGAVLMLRDISQEQEQKSRHAEFVSSVCHELKTPMASIKAFLEMLIDGDVEDADEQLRLFGFMDVQVDRLTRLVNNMLNMARIESGVIKVQREDCGLNDVLEKALEVVRPMAEEKQQQLIPQFSELYVPVNVDRDLFGQAVINLLSNAVKYTPDGGEVRLRSRMRDGEAVVDVQDTGLGIPEADMNRLFQRFFRVERNNKAAAGTGLGLALVRYIVHDIHGGRVEVRSEVDKGSCFSITIPVGHRDQGRRKVEANLCVV